MKLKSKISIKFFLGVVTFLLLFGGCSTLKNGAEDERLDILAYYAPPAEFATVERYREMVECGFTHGLYAFPVGDIKTMDAMLDAAEKGGIKLFVNCDELKAEPEKTAEHFKDHPALAGYFIKDEPTAAFFPQLAETVKRIQSVDSEHPCFINLFPNYANAEQLGTETYQQHVDKFLAEVPVTFLSFDYYPIWDYRVRGSWYENLEIASRATREKGMPFWAFALVSTHYYFTPATVAHIRLQQFTNLAYGTQGLEYFPYWEPNDDHFCCPIQFDGSRSSTFDNVKKVNAEIQSVAWVFKGSKVIDLGHTGKKKQWRERGQRGPDAPPQEEGPLPPGTTHYELASPVKRFVAQGQFGALVSTLAKGERRFLVILNKDYANIMVVDMEFDGTKEISIVNKDGKMQKLADNNFKKLIDPSGMTIFTWLEN